MAVAVELLEHLPPGPELAHAYDNLAFLDTMEPDVESARAWTRRAIAVAEELGDPWTTAYVSGMADLIDVASGVAEGLKEFDAVWTSPFARATNRMPRT